MAWKVKVLIWTTGVTWKCRNVGVNSGLPHPSNAVLDSLRLKEYQIMSYLSSLSEHWLSTYKGWQFNSNLYLLQEPPALVRLIIMWFRGASSGSSLYTGPGFLSGVTVCLLARPGVLAHPWRPAPLCLGTLLTFLLNIFCGGFPLITISSSKFYPCLIFISITQILC